MAGIYIHVPFCKQACTYCNFHFSTNLGLQNDFTAALLKETELRRPYLQGERVETIYFGGGTPSLLTYSALQQILDSISRLTPILRLHWKQIRMTWIQAFCRIGKNQVLTA